MQRPTSVTVIGWLSIGLGIITAFSGLFALIVFSTMPPQTPQGPLPSNFPPPFALMFKLFDYFPFFAGGQLAVAAAMIIGGAAFLKCKAWARTLLEVLAWLGLAYLVAFGAFWLYGVASMGPSGPQDPGAPPLFFPMLFAMGLLVILSFLVPTIVVIKVLRGATVRRAMV